MPRRSSKLLSLMIALLLKHRSASQTRYNNRERPSLAPSMLGRRVWQETGAATRVGNYSAIAREIVLALSRAVVTC